MKRQYLNREQHAELSRHVDEIDNRISLMLRLMSGRTPACLGDQLLRLDRDLSRLSMALESEMYRRHPPDRGAISGGPLRSSRCPREPIDSSSFSIAQREVAR